MLIVNCFPQRFKDFFRQFSEKLGIEVDVYNYLWRIVLALACLEGRVSLKKIAAFTGKWRTRQSFKIFLDQADWDERAALNRKAFTTLRQLGWTVGQPLYLAIDDTQIQKRGSCMEGVSKLFLHSEKKFAIAHSVVVAAFIYRGIVIPYALRLWLSKEVCKQLQQKDRSIRFRTMTELASDCVRSLPSSLGNVTVVFDCYYLCKTVINVCKEKGLHYVGAVKSNRKIKKDVYAKTSAQVGVYSNGFLAQGGRLFKIKGSVAFHRIAAKICYLVKAGTVKLVFSRRIGDNQAIVLATNNINCPARKVVEIYRNRWQIEVLFKSAKQNLGMGDYQFLKRRAIERYLHLVMISHIFLTHLAYQELNEKSSKKVSNPICITGISETKMKLRNILISDLLEKWKAPNNDPKVARMFREFRQKAVAMFTGKDYYEKEKGNMSC